jgi:hypothetical protein
LHFSHSFLFGVTRSPATASFFGLPFFAVTSG